MKNFKKISISFIGCLTLFSQYQSIAFANNNEIELKQINVQAPNENSYTVNNSSASTGLNLQLKDTPQSISVISQQRIKEQNLRTLNDIIEQSTGVHKLQIGANESGYTQFFTRGYQIHNINIDGRVNNFNKYLASYKVQSTAPSIENVNIVKGATGLMSGIGDPSAYIVVNKKKPTAQLQQEIGLNLGNNKQHFSAFYDLSGALNQDASLRGRTIIDFAKNKTQQERGKNKDFGLYGVLEYDVTPNTLLSSSIEYNYTNSKNLSISSFPLLDNKFEYTSFSTKDNAATNNAFSDQKTINFNTNLTHHFNDNWQLKINYNFTKHNFEQLYSGIDQLSFIDDTYNLTENLLLSEGFYNYKPIVHNFSSDINGVFNLFGHQHEIFAGVSLYKEQETNIPNYNSRQRLPLTEEQKDNIIKTGVAPEKFDISTIYQGQITKNFKKQISAYASTRINIIDNLALIVGTRFSNWEEDYTGFWSRDIVKEKNIITPYLGLIYNLTDDISAYASYSTIFNPQKDKDRYGKTLKPEKGSNIEVGIKANLLDNLNASIALFQTKKDNLAVSDAPYKVLNTNIDAKKAEDNTLGKGLEVELQGSINPNWNIQAGYSYFTLKDSKETPLNTEHPKHLFNLFTSYKFNVNHKPLTLGAGIKWNSQIEKPFMMNPNITIKQEPVYLIDVMASYDLTKNTNLKLNISNLFNKQYLKNVMGEHSYGNLRTVTLGLNYKF